MSNQRKITEAEVRNAVRRALKQVLEDIENEPTLVIDTGDKSEDLPDETLTDIRKWLFERR